jgi:hypothetical protein
MFSKLELVACCRCVILLPRKPQPCFVDHTIFYYQVNAAGYMSLVQKLRNIKAKKINPTAPS